MFPAGFLAAVVAVGLCSNAFARAVETETIRITPPPAIDVPSIPNHMEFDPAEEFYEEAEERAPLPIPQVLYSAETLPAPVVAMREKLNKAAKEGNIEAFRAIFDAQQVKPILSYDRVEDPIAFLKDTSGDGEGLELLAIMQDILETGYVHINEGKEDEAYVWPYFAQYPLDSLDNKQLVEMYRVVTSIDYFEMRDYGAWTFYKVAISPKGDLLYFVAGD